jgi:PAS domain S-box-containing protein
MASGDDRARLEALMDTMRAWTAATPDPPRLIEGIARRVVEILGDVALLALLSDDRRMLQVCAAAARDESVENRLTTIFSAPLEVAGGGIVSRVGTGGPPEFLPLVDPGDLATLVAPPYREIVRSLGVHSLLAVPLPGDTAPIGVLCVARHRQPPRSLDAEDFAFARSLGQCAGLALGNARLLEAQRRELEERRRLQAEANKFAALVHHSIDMIGMASLEGRVLFVNPAGRRLVGLALDHDVTTLTLDDFHTNRGMERATILRRDGFWQGEGHLRHFQTGELIPTRVSSFMVRDHAGDPACFATIQQDLRTTHTLQAQLIRAQRMEAVGQLVSTIAHDFNNLLSVIISYSSLLAESLPADAGARDDVREIALAGERAAALTRQLLTFTSKQRLEPRVIQLNDVVTDMARMVGRAAGEGVKVAVTLDDSLGLVSADSSHVGQVILNLVMNARDAMPAGGALGLATRDVEVAAGGDLPVGRWAVLEVTDTGEGIDDEARARLFEPFFTTKAPGKGTGLGLAIVDSIVKQSGGHIRVESARGKGTTVRIYLPRLTAGGLAAVRELELSGGLPGGRGERVLVVDDDEQVRQLMRSVLARAGYQVLDVDDARQALALAEHPGNEPRLLVTDVALPGIGGRELADRLAARHRGLRVLFVSGYTDEVLARHGLLEPGIELLRKPITPATLLRRTRKALDARTGWTVSPPR